jgi:putative ABC transport system ATP-binding protein
VDNSSQKLAVHARKVSKTFKTGDSSIHALKEVDFHVHVGELLMIVGPSGCGKTTLLSVIAGTLHFDGEIDVLDFSLHKMTEAQITQLRKLHIGFIFQQYHLIKTLTCLENVSIPLLLNNIPPKEAEERAAAMLEKVGLKGREYDNPKYLSGGQQQRISIARALVHEPSLVICDEPTAALDAETGAQVMELLRKIVEKPGRTAIIVTHDNRIFKYADRIVKMDDGSIDRTT